MTTKDFLDYLNDHAIYAEIGDERVELPQLNPVLLPHFAAVNPDAPVEDYLRACKNAVDRYQALCYGFDRLSN